jgi:hypothetical protein
LGNTFGATTLAHIARLGAELHLKTRSLFAVTIFALVLSLVVSAVFTLYLGYAHGAYNFNVYTFNSGNRVVFDNVVQKLQTPFDTSLDRMMFLGIGASVASLCSFLRYRFFVVAAESHWANGVYHGCDPTPSVDDFFGLGDQICVA